MEKEYIVELRITVDQDDLKEYMNVQDMIYETMEDVPFCFDIEDCREVQ